MFLERNEIGLRPVEESDLPMLQAWRNNPGTREPFREYRPLNMINQKRWFDSLDDRCIMFVIMAGRPIGVCGLTSIDRHNRNAELSFYIGESVHEGQIHEVIELLLDYAFKEVGLHRVYAEQYEGLPNTGWSLERHGFEQEGILRDVVFKHGRFWNSVIMSMLEDTQRCFNPRLRAGGDFSL
jgi:RimJ/RimL family protein N-acetyltransferase